MAVEQFFSPVSLDEAVGYSSGDKTAFLAGGTDLLVAIRLGQNCPKTLIDLKKIPDLSKIVFEENVVRIGAAVSGAKVSQNHTLTAMFPGLAEAMDLIGSTQIQGRCSAGGNLCNASPAADCIPALIVNGAKCRIHGSDGERLLPVEEFVVGPNQNALKDRELLVQLLLPKPDPRTSDAYLRLTPRTEMDIAVAGAAVSITIDLQGVCTSARVSIGAVAPTAVLVEAAGSALVGTHFEESAIDRVVEAVRQAACPISDKRGSAEYRTHVVGVLVRRSIQLAKARVVLGEAT